MQYKTNAVFLVFFYFILNISRSAFSFQFNKCSTTKKLYVKVTPIKRNTVSKKTKQKTNKHCDHTMVLLQSQYILYITKQITFVVMYVFSAIKQLMIHFTNNLACHLFHYISNP